MWGVLDIILWVLHLPYVGRMGGLARLWVLVVPFFVSSIQLDEDLEGALLENPLRDEYIDADCGHDIDCLMEGIYPTQTSLGGITSVSPIRKCALNSVLWGEWFQCDTTRHRNRLYIEGEQAVYKTVSIDPKEQTEVEINYSKVVCPQRLEFQLKDSKTEGEKLINTGLFCIASSQFSYRYVRMVHCWSGHCMFTHPATGEQRTIQRRYSAWHLNEHMRPHKQSFNVDIFIGLQLIETSDINSHYLSNAIGFQRSIELIYTLPKYYFCYKLVDKRPQVSVFLSDKGETGFGVRLRELPTVQSNYPEFFVRVTEKVSVSAHSVLRSNLHGCTNDFFSVYKGYVYCHPDNFSSSTSAHIELLRKGGMVVKEIENLVSKPGWISYGVSKNNFENDITLNYGTALEKQPCCIRTETKAFLISHSELCFEGFAQAPHSNSSVTSWDRNLSKDIQLSWEPLLFDGEFVVSDIYKISPPRKHYVQPVTWALDYLSLPKLFSAHLILGMVRYPVQFFVTNSAIVKVSFSKTGELQVDGQPMAKASTIYEIHDQASRNIIVGITQNNREAGPLLRPGETFTTIALGPVAHIFDSVVRVTGFHIILINTHEAVPFHMKFFADALAHFANSKHVNKSLNRYLGVLRPDIACIKFWRNTCEHERYEQFLLRIGATLTFLKDLTNFVLDGMTEDIEVENSYKRLIINIKMEEALYNSVSLRYQMTSHDIFREYLRYKLNLSLPDYQDRVAVERIFEMLTLNKRQKSYFDSARVVANKLEGEPGNNQLSKLERHLDKKRQPLVITQQHYRTVALRGIDRLVAHILLTGTDPSHYNMWRGFFPESASDVVDALDAFYHLSSFPIIREEHFPRLIETLRLMRVLLPPYQALNIHDVWLPSEERISEMQGQEAIMADTLATLTFAKEECLDSLACTPAFFELRKNLAKSVDCLKVVSEWELAAYHFTCAQVVFEVRTHEAVDEMIRETEDSRYQDGVICIREGFSFAATRLHLKLVCYIVDPDVRRSVDTSIANLSRKLHSPSPKWKVRRLLGTSLLQPIIDLHAKALKSYSSHIFRVDTHLVHSVKLLSINFKLKNLLQRFQQSETFQNIVYKEAPSRDYGPDGVTDQLKLLTSENWNFAPTLNRKIVIEQYIPPDFSHAKNLFSHKPLILLSLIILIL